MHVYGCVCNYVTLFDLSFFPGLEFPRLWTSQIGPLGKGDCLSHCDTIYEVKTKTPILVWQRGERVNFLSNLRDVIHECSLKQLFWVTEGEEGQIWRKKSRSYGNKLRNKLLMGSKVVELKIESKDKSDHCTEGQDLYKRHSQIMYCS